MLDTVKQAPPIKGLYINGQWKTLSRQFNDINPSDGSVWASIPDAGLADTQQAIDAAHTAFTGWSALPFQERAHYLLKIADVWEKKSAAFVSAACFEGGGWFGKGMFETGYVAEVFRAAAGLCYGAIGEVLPSAHGKVSTATRQALGVVGVISPWNMPGILTARGFAFPLAAGNTIVLKPSEDTPYAGGLFFAEVLEEAGLPAGVFNVVTCSREQVQEVGDELINNPKVKGISFTGSTAVGRSIAAKCGAHLKKCCVELGGKDSLIVLDDANLDRAVSAASFGAFMHQGQICMSVEKILVQDSVYPEFLRRFVKQASTLKTGNVEDRSNVIGPLINDRQVDRVRQQIEDAVARGARIELGGTIDGLFVTPTILSQVTQDMQVWQDETFGPVAVVMPFSSDAEAITMNNDTEYGLSSGIITRNEERALAMSGQLETGMCHVNCSSVNDEPHVPFGGSKASGLGRHGGKWSLETFSETRWITLDRGGRPFPPVFQES